MKRKINWKLRFKNKVTLTAIIFGVVALVYQILGVLGVTPSISQDQITQIVGMLINLLVLVGIVVDPRLNRNIMMYLNSAIRTVKRFEVAAEFYSYPQKYVTGLSENAEILDKWKAAMSSMMSFGKDEDGDKPTVGQFNQGSMQPHVEQLKMFAALFAGDSGLTLDDLGFVTDNPSSVEAIKAAHENLKLAARKAQRNFGSGFLNAGYLAACIRDEFPYRREQIYLTNAKWEPIFEPDAAMLSSMGDGIIKINQAVPGYFDNKTLRNLTGIEGG